MTYKELRAFTVTMTNRPELDVIQTGETLTRIQTALKAAHTSLQQDELVDNSFRVPVRMIPDWQSQVYTKGDVTTPVVFISGSTGIDVTTLPQTGCTLKRITDVRQIRTVGTVTDVTPIDPATATEIEWFKLSEHLEFQNRSLPKGLYHQRWFEDEGKLKLLQPIGHNGQNFNLRVRMLQLLKFYVNETDHDYFSDQLWQTLAHGAAYYCFLFIGETEDAASAKGLFEESAVKALRADRRNSQGGVAGVRRPPLATGRRY